MKPDFALLAGLSFLATITLNAHAANVTFGSGANQFAIEFLDIGNPGNAADATGSPNPAGSVGYLYQIGKFEISEDMIDKANAPVAQGGGNLGITKDTRAADKPATNITWFEAATFVNWLNTSEGFQAAYNFDGGGNFQLWSAAEAWQKDGQNLFRHKDAQYFLPGVDEWYKAAYYDSGSGSYFNYPTGSTSAPDGIDFAGDTTFDAVFFDGGSNPDPNDITDAGVLSPYGTMAQGGNVWELEESAFDPVNNTAGEDRAIRGGSWFSSAGNLLSTVRVDYDPTLEDINVGFRVAAVPEPSRTVLALLGLTGVLLMRRKRGSD